MSAVRITGILTAVGSAFVRIIATLIIAVTEKMSWDASAMRLTLELVR